MSSFTTFPAIVKLEDDINYWNTKILNEDIIIAEVIARLQRETA